MVIICTANNKITCYLVEARHFSDARALLLATKKPYVIVKRSKRTNGMSKMIIIFISPDTY